MEKLKRIVAAVLLLALGTSLFAGCSDRKRGGPLDVEKVTYVIYGGYVNHDEVYVITSDHKVTQYSIDPDPHTRYDYLNGEFPSGDECKITEYEMDEMDWTSMVNVLTRVNFMEMEEDIIPSGDIDDACTYFIKVETSDAVHTSGGYAAGTGDSVDDRNFAKAQQYICNALN